MVPPPEGGVVPPPEGGVLPGTGGGAPKLMVPSPLSTAPGGSVPLGLGMVMLPSVPVVGCWKPAGGGTDKLPSELTVVPVG